ncbi:MULTISPECIES: hypothetical protein [Alcanivorax]|uniref:hypothetical protein n=1 Tax=Alcanivorax TaxID=59753 RepID=UPI0004B8950D|nr:MULTISPECIES: hypothetical protein [Alcanivorax]
MDDTSLRHQRCLDLDEIVTPSGSLQEIANDTTQVNRKPAPTRSSLSNTFAGRSPN